MQFLDINGVKRFKRYTDDTFITSEDITTVEDATFDNFYTKTEIDTLLENIETGTTNLATVATTGSYNDLSDKPTIPSIDTIPTSGSGNVVTSDGIKTALDNKIQYGDIILSNNAFATNNRLYITKIDDSLYGAAQRYNVTHKYYNATDDSLLGDVPNTTNLFNCDYEVTSQLVKDGTYAELYIGKVAEDDLGNTSSYLWTYGAGEIYCSFYSNMFPSSMSAKVYCRAHSSSGQTAGWYDLTVTQVSTNVYKLTYPSGNGTTYTTAFKIKYGGRTIGSYGASLCEVEMYRTRAAVSEQAAITKYPIPQEILGNLTAPAFIKKGGTSSQFLKADGSVDSNTYALASSIPATVTESTVAGWGFTKNSGTYSKPSGGIPKTDLASAVQTSLGKADTALQSYTETDPTVPSWAKAANKPTYTAAEVGALPSTTSIPTESTVSGWGFTKNSGTITGITMNGTSKGTSGVVDLGTVLTSHQDISGKANDSAVVHLAGEETITGNKTFNGNIHLPDPSSIYFTDTQEGLDEIIYSIPNITISSSEPTSSQGNSGDIWIVI